jgi:hypothetical protein
MEVRDVLKTLLSFALDMNIFCEVDGKRYEVLHVKGINENGCRQAVFVAKERR